MTIQKPKLLIYGAGVIGSLYALRFIHSDMDVTILARGERLKSLQEKGLQYSDKKIINSVPVKVIDHLEDDDIYDFIFLGLRYDHMTDALQSIKNNQSKTIVPLTNTIHYNDWLQIVGNRLLPGFPGAGGDIRNNILYAKFTSGKTQGTVFAEIDGTRSKRIEQLEDIFMRANLPYEIPEDIFAFHISHAALIMPNKHLYTKDGMIDLSTAKSKEVLLSITKDIKENIHIIESMNITITPKNTRMLTKLPVSILALAYRIMLSIPFTREVMMGEHTKAAGAEVFLLDKEFKKYIETKKEWN